MKIIPLVGLLLILVSGCKTEENTDTLSFMETVEPKSIIDGPGFQVPVYDYNGFKTLLEQEDDYTYVINFWATWCAPCIAELPYFEEITAAYPEEKIRVVLVNLDMAKMWESHLVPFLEKRAVKSHVMVLEDPRQNTWIPKVDQEWSGAIPATLIYNRHMRKFYEQPFSFEELQTELYSFLKDKSHENKAHATNRGTGHDRQFLQSGAGTGS